LHVGFGEVMLKLADLRSFGMDLDVVHNRLSRLEKEVDGVKSDLNEQKLAVVRISEQVTAHSARGEERHAQLLGEFRDMKTDFRILLRQQTEDAQSRQAFQNKLFLAVLGIVSTLVAGVLGFKPPVTTQTTPAHQTTKANGR